MTIAGNIRETGDAKYASLHGALTAAVALSLLVVVAMVPLRVVLMSLPNPGYDFRYFWLAGQVWADGASPYGPALSAAGARLIAEGHVPVIWPYPPNLWLPTVMLSPFGLTTAWTLWEDLQILMLIAASAVVARLMGQGGMGQGGRLALATLFFLHLAFVAALEATAASLRSGQIVPLLYLAAALLLLGLGRGWRLVPVLALTVLFFKPQIGGLIAIGLMAGGGRGLRIVLGAAALSLLLMLPALWGDPGAVAGWLGTLGRYDGVNTANLPEAMTGLRNLIHAATGVTVSNLAAMALTVLVSAGAAIWQGRRLRQQGGCPLQVIVQTQLLLALALAPLHLYDFILLGAAAPLLRGLGGPALVAAGLAFGAVVQPGPLFAVLSGGAARVIFVGSTLCTAGAVVLLLIALTRWAGEAAVRRA